MNPMRLEDFYNGKRVLITGHTGFKGSWLSRILSNMGADVFGISLDPPTTPNLFSIIENSTNISTTIADIRDLGVIKDVVNRTKPEIIIHMAAQPLVSVGYSNPVYTYETNVMGTVNILEASRNVNTVKSILNVTTDKVYQNNEWCWGYREEDTLNGYDPYSNSKSCSELVTSCYTKSFFGEGTSVSTCRAGNVIGGGDFSDNRIIPDCIRAAISGLPMILRNPYSTRPYQHVLEPLFAYLLIAAKQYGNQRFAGSYNVGPDSASNVNNEVLVQLFKKNWGLDFSYTVATSKELFHEANYLKLDCSKIKSVFGWNPIFSIEEAICKTIDWTKAWSSQRNSLEIMDNQIDDYSKKFLPIN